MSPSASRPPPATAAAASPPTVCPPPTPAAPAATATLVTAPTTAAPSVAAPLDTIAITSATSAASPSEIELNQTLRLPALSLQEPFADALVRGAKTVESRNSSMLAPFAGLLVAVRSGCGRWPTSRGQPTVAGPSKGTGVISGVVHLGATQSKQSLAAVCGEDAVAGNTLEGLRAVVFGKQAMGLPTDPPLDRRTGVGRVDATAGHYMNRPKLAARQAGLCAAPGPGPPAAGSSWRPRDAPHDLGLRWVEQ